MAQGKEGPAEYSLDLMTDTLKQLEMGVRGAFLQKLFQNLVGRSFSEGESITHWERILARQSQWAEKLGCTVTLRTAVLVHFEELAILRNPVLLEYAELKKLRYNAATDSLTGLNNRRMFEEYLEQEIDRSTRYGFPFALLLFDLHKFKNVNDTYGHGTGDELLRSVARASLETVRGSDVPCRIGGDEFAILLPQADRSGSEVLAERIARKFEEYARSLAPATPVGINYGIAIFPGEGHDVASLLAVADRSLYANKQKVHDPSPEHAISPPATATHAEESALQIKIEQDHRKFRCPPSLSVPAVAGRIGDKGRASENGPDARRFERVRLDGALALGIVRAAGKSCTVEVLDASRVGVGILVDQIDLPEVFQALLQVPILPGGELAFQRIYSLPLSEGKRRVGCVLTSTLSSK